MEGWTLLSSDRQVVPHELRAASELLYANLRLGAEAFPELYWQAPPSYLGDKVSERGRPWGRHCEGVQEPPGGWGRTAVRCPRPGRDRGSVRAPGAQPSPVAGDPGPAVRVWPGHVSLPCLQVSSYGGTLRYELHSETQRGDVFIPMDSRPDVVLQVAGRGGCGRAGWRAPPSGTAGSPAAGPHLPARLPRATR